MPMFGSGSSSPAADSSLRLPAQKRISTAASQRLSTITEGANASAAARANAQPRGILRNASSPRPGSPLRPSYDRQASGGASRRQSQDTTRTGPPAYSWIPEPVDGEEDLTAPVEGEKLAQLRRDGGHIRRKRDRGGWGRLALIIGLVLLVIGLAVGLGVGLTVGKKHNKSSSSKQSSQPANSTSSSEPTQHFPLGEYSMITALRTVDTNCTAYADTWRCYPYSVYDASDGTTNTSSLATFNWIISNTSAVYATNTTGSTSEQGIPSNLTISSTNNPFSVEFSNASLTYISISSNSSSPRYTFSFTMQKAVIPSSQITSSGAAAECFYNSTIFTGTLYLSANHTFPSDLSAHDTSIGGYTPWPYALEIKQSSPGGENIPACYELVNGGVGDRILTMDLTEPVGSQCFCDYRNY